MKKAGLLVCFSFCVFSHAFCQGGIWTWISGSNQLASSGVFGTQGIPSINNQPPGLYEAAEWKDKQGNFWIYGGWWTDYCDLWKFNPVTLEWTWVQGSGIPYSPTVYGTQGVPSPANSPGERDGAAVTWADTIGNLWLFGGGYYHNDLWKYDISINMWTWVKGDSSTIYVSGAGIYGTQGIPSPSNKPYGRRETCSAWVDQYNNLWLYGGLGYDNSGVFGGFNDLMKYDINTNEWTWMNGSPNLNVIANYGTKGVANPNNDPGARCPYTKWKDTQGNFWFMGGVSTSCLNDVWKYNPNINQWTWVNGPNVTDDVGKYQAKCLSDTINMPASRVEQRSAVTDNCGRFWLFGGSNYSIKGLNDLWLFDPTKLEWKWLSGTNIGNQLGSYGTLGVPSTSNIQPSRCGAVAWWGNDNRFYMFGGVAVYSPYDCFSDVWAFTPDTNCVSFFCAALPKANFISSDTTFCDEAGKCLNFSDHSINNPTSWHWLFPGASPNNSNQQNPTNICYTQPGTYAVTLIVTNAAGSDTLTVSPMITVGTNPPSPTLTVSNDTIYCNHASVYQWYRDGNVIAGATDSFYVFSQNGTYAVQITDSIGCSRLSDGVVITGVPFTVYGSQFGVYPNPAGDEFTVYGLEFTVNTTLEVYNVFGEKVYSRQIKAGKSKPETVNCKQLASGLYFIRVTDERGSYSGKFVKH